jgi:hypothetical protein
MFKRVIRDDNNYTSKDIVNVPINQKIYHPITLEKIDTTNFKNPICLTKMYVSDNKLNTFSNYICNGENKYKQYIQLPPVALNSSNLLEIYDINNIDNLKDWVENNIYVYNRITLSRVVSCWIINNFDTLKLYKKHLENISIFILIDEYNKRQLEKFDYEEDVKQFINDWINNYTIDKDSNLLKNLLIHFNKKYSII